MGKAIKHINDKDVAIFVYEDIYSKVGVSLELLFDQGPSFRGGLVL